MTPITINNNKDKRTKRRKQTAEDFTPAWLVKQMLDKLYEYNNDTWKDPRKTFIDPACGNGNFLVEIAKRKLKSGHKALDVANTVFGLDIMQDNIQEARYRVCRVFDMFNKLDENVVLLIWKNVRRVDDTLGVDFNKAVFNSKKADKSNLKSIMRKVHEMNKDHKKIKVRRRFIKNYFYNNEHIQALQNIHTPFSLAKSMVKKLEGFTGLTDGKKYLCFNPEFIEALVGEGVSADNIWFMSECPEKVSFVGQVFNVHTVLDDFVSWKHGDKFDVVIGNPPFQGNTGKGKKGTRTLWDKFIGKSIDICKDDGFISLIHPCGWRAPKGSYKNIKEKMTNNKIHYLEIHNAKDGMKTFNAGTRYDWYVMQKCPAYGETDIIAEDGTEYRKNISNLPFIPNSMFDEVMNLIADEGEETVNILANSTYHATNGQKKGFISKEQSSEFKYPIIHSIRKKDQYIIWSNEDKGMFGIPKILFGRGKTRLLLDLNGEYGISQDVYAIVDNPKYLQKINKALENEEFIKISSVCNLVSTGMFIDKYNKDVLALFRKDFWKDFI